MALFSLLLGASLLSTTFGQSSTSVYIEPTVPTGTPVPGNYTGSLRPQIHFSPPQNFMNDPNGMFYYNSTFHLYYQYDATGLVAGNQHWGHATSKDLYHWENQPIALFPPNNYTYVFSGSAVVDVNNTSGFFPNQANGVVAVFTLAEYPGGLAGPQQQAIAYSYDEGYSFIMYEGNPVIPSTSSQFRDPKVIWYEDHWVMVVSYAQEFAIGFFTSPDLKNWTHQSNFSYHGILGLQYECPNLVEMPVLGTDTTLYVLQISVNPGAPLGGSISQNFPGTFNGTHFTPVDGVARINDFGKDNYAGQFFYGIPSGEDAVSIGWSSNWQYSQIVPTGPLEGWRSLGWDMISAPYDLSPVLENQLASNNSLNNGTMLVDYSNIYSNAVYFEVNVTGINATTVSGSATFNYTFYSPVSQEYLSGGFFFGGNNDFWINRGGIRGFDNIFFTDKFSTGHPINANGTWSMTAVIDRSILEVFAEGGQRSATTTFFPTQPLTTLILASADLLPSMSVSVAVWGIESAWLQYENEQGTVFGNVTTNGTTMGKRHMEYDAGYRAVEFDA